MRATTFDLEKRRLGGPIAGDHWPDRQMIPGVVGLAVCCAFVGCCVGFWFANVIPIGTVATGGFLAGVMLGFYIGRDDSAPRAAFVMAPSNPYSQPYLAALCAVLSGLIMGFLLAGRLEASGALFVSLVAGGALGCYVSRVIK